MTSARRQAELVVSFSPPDLDLLVDRLPPGISITSDKFGRYVVAQSSDKLTGDAAETHLSWLWTKCEPLITLIGRNGLVPTGCVLRLVQYVHAEDDIGPGVPIEKKWVAAIAQLGGSFDLDMYVSEE